ncbi:MAG TPA: hemolysin family protein [Kiritimatiellia bacterium]|nr:hemolysin family protein [Kiritimatiellia bacterium]HRU70572.1 hemolysin family protein [Kiritimatiellia bacterium]
MNPFFMWGGSVILLMLFALSAFFSGCETVLFSLSPIQVQRIRNRHAAAGRRLETLLADPALILSTLLVGNSLVNFAIASVGYILVKAMIPHWGEVVAIPLMTVSLLLFGEVTPKRIAVIHAERLAPLCSQLLLFWLWLLRPFNVVLTSASRIFKKSLRRERRALSNDELLTVVEVGEEQGVIDEEEASMVDGILRLSELKASDEMTPRVDMVGIDLDTPVEQQVAIARGAGHRYLPVYVRTPDAIEGFLDTVQFLLDPAHDVRKATRQALFVPENVSLDDLLVTFQRSGKHIACVLDEYGGTAGLITRGDILELITDPVTSAKEEDDSPIRRVGPDVWLLEGTVSLEEVNHELDLQLEADDADRIAGWVTFHAGRLLKTGQCVVAQGCRVTVRRMRKQRIEAVQLEVLERPDEDALEQVVNDDMLEGPDDGEEL